MMRLPMVWDAEAGIVTEVLLHNLEEEVVDMVVVVIMIVNEGVPRVQVADMAILVDVINEVLCQSERLGTMSLDQLALVPYPSLLLLFVVMYNQHPPCWLTS